MTALVLPTQTGHLGLLGWAFRDLFPSISAAQQRAMVRQAEQLPAPSAQREVECGFELHHDLTGRVDFGFHCQSQLLDPAVTALPQWWPALVRGTSASDGLLRFQSRHWLEFDQRAGGPVQLAGLFQHCDTNVRRDPRAFDALLGHFAGIGCFPGQDVRRSGALRSFFEAFGVPFQWGVMVGRPEGLKVVAMIEAIDAAGLEAFVDRAGLTLERGWSRTLAEPPNGMQFAISLDVNLAADRFGPNVGVEITGPDRTAPVNQWSGLQALLDGLGVEREQIVAMWRATAPLPSGQRVQLSCFGLEDFLADELRTVSRLASLNHLKLSFRAGRPAAVKSYVSLREVKGGAGSQR